MSYKPKLKQTFKAARAIQDETIKEAANSMGYSKTSIDRFFSDDYKYSKHVETAIKNYIYSAGLFKSFEDLGLDPNITKAEINDGVKASAG